MNTPAQKKAQAKYMSKPENKAKYREWMKIYQTNLRRRLKEYGQLNKLRGEDKITAEEHSDLILKIK